MSELIDLTLDPADLAGVHALLASLEEAMPFLRSLSAAQVKSLFKLGPQSEAFVQKTLVAAEQHARLLPPNTSVAAMRRDAALRAALRPIRAKVAALLEMLDGTMILAGADLMKSASAVYRTLRIHAKGEGIDGLLDDMGKRFAKRPKRVAADEEATKVENEPQPTTADARAITRRKEPAPQPPGDPERVPKRPQEEERGHMRSAQSAWTNVDATLEHGVPRADAFLHAPTANDAADPGARSEPLHASNGRNAVPHKSP